MPVSMSKMSVGLGHVLQALPAYGEVLGVGLLREVQHVAAEEGLALGLMIVLVGQQRAIEPEPRAQRPPRGR